MAAGLVLLGATPAAPIVFHAKDEALELAFPGADRVEGHDHFLDPESRSEIEHRAKAPLDSSLLTVYEGYRDGELLGYAIFDSHLVRTLPETFLVVLSPDGEVKATHVLAFYEPLEYLPPERWLAQIESRRLDDDFHVGRGIAAITGSTLTSRAVVSGIRRALAIHTVLLAPR